MQKHKKNYVYNLKVDFKIGELVVPNLKFGVTSLLLWRFQDNEVINEVVTKVKKGCLLTIVKTMPLNASEAILNDEWHGGAYLLLAPGGKLGWSGAGWLKRLPACSKTYRKTVGHKRNVNANRLSK